MKKEILERLKVKFKGVSNSILCRIVKKVTKTVKTPENVVSFVEGLTLQQLLESYGDIRATEAAKKAISTYEKKQRLKDGVKIDNGDNSSKKGKLVKKTEEDNKTNTHDSILLAINSLKEELLAIKREKVTDDQTKRFNNVIANVPNMHKLRLTKDFEHLKSTFKNDNDFEGYITDLEADIETNVNLSQVREVKSNYTPKGSGMTKYFKSLLRKPGY